MGFSVSGSAAIIFIGLMVATGIAVPSLIGSFGSLANAQGGQIDRGVDAMNTEFEIETTTYDDETDELEITLKNTGSTTLFVERTSVLVNGELKPDAATGSERYWVPNETITITITVEEDTESGQIKVVVENGIAQTAGFGA